MPVYSTRLLWYDQNIFPLVARGGYEIDIALFARRIVELVEDKQAHDIILLDIRKQSTLADYFVICSADNDRQLRAVVEHIDEVVRREYQLKPRIEGTANTGWIVLDYDDVVLHVFSGAQREYYQLERLWNKASPVVIVQ
jgi:ribosome-associated protein